MSILAVFLLIFGCCYGNQLSADFDEVNSLTNFVQKVQHFLDQDDNGISEKCSNHWNEYIDGLKNSNKIWALRMFDSSSKIPSGILEGNFADLGFFDECLDTEGNTTSTASFETIYGKYCLASLPLSTLINKTQHQLPNAADDLHHIATERISTSNRERGIQFAACVPNTCSAIELTKIYADIGFKLRFYDDMCQTKFDWPELDSGAIATVSFLGLILCIMLFCTAYDVILHYSEKRPAHPVLISFSILTNGRKLLATSNSPNQISCLHGIRVISTMWVILGHRYSTQLHYPVRNFLYTSEFQDKRSSMFMINAPLSVDSFFLMSGVVLVYVYLSAVSKGIKFNVILFYVHRYLRLTPVLAVIVLIHVTLFKYFGSGPLFPSSIGTELVDSCEQYWWKTLLYIQNYGAQKVFCIPQSWYLCVDTQLFLLSPIILIPLKRWPIPTLFATGILTLGSMLASFLTGWFMELNMNFAGNRGQAAEDYMKYYYAATHTRASPWLIGLVLGYYIFQVKQRKVRLTVDKGLILVVWVTAMAVLLTCVLTGQNLIFDMKEKNQAANSIHMALVRPAWSIALSWIIFACVIGYGGPVNWFLSLPVFQVLSKFTYTLYLLHLQLIIIIALQIRTPPIFSHEKMMYVFWGDFAFSLALAVLFTLAFESPMITIEQLVFGKTKKREIKPAKPKADKRTDKHTEVA